jgi:NitT/TauT family transport system substrate-binding protein
MRGARLSIFFACALAFFVLLPTPNPRAESVRFALGWVPFGRDAGWFAAVEKGLYAAEGLQVTISRGFGGADSIQKLGAGTFDVGMTDPGSLLLGRAKGIKIKMVGMYHDKAPFVLRWLEGSGINSLKDLEGKTVGAPAGDSNLKILPALMELNGLDFKKIKVIHVAPAARESMLVSGKLDAVTGFHIQQPMINVMAGKQGKKVKMVLFADHGVDVYGFGVAVMEDYAKANAGTLRKFMRASVKGMAFGIEHPDEAVKMWLKHYPQGNPKTNRQVWDLTIDGMLTKEQMKLGIWRMERKKWVTTRDILTKGYGLKVKIPVDDLYTNEYLPTIMSPKRGPRKIPRLW